MGIRPNIPLGGNRKGRFRAYLNQFLTMVLGGLWHGANWTFMALVLAWQFLKAFSWDKIMELPYGSVYSYTVLMTMIWMIFLFRPTGFAPFVYGQF